MKVDMNQNPFVLDQIVLSDMSGTQIGPSGVRALPGAAGTNEGGHYF